MKKVLAILFSLVFLFSFSLLAFAEDAADGADTSTYGSFSDWAGGVGKSITDLITSYGGEVEFDFETLFSSLGALGDIDFAGYLGQISLSNIMNGFSEMADGFFDTENISTDGGLGAVIGDLGFGDFSNILEGGLESILGIGAEDSEDGEDGGDSSGITGIISSVAGSIADMTSNFDISSLFSGILNSGSNEENNSGSSGGTGTTTTPTIPSNNSNNSSSVGSVPVITNPTVVQPETEIEMTTQEYTTRTGTYVIVPGDEPSPIPDDTTDGPSKQAIAGGIILVLGSFGAIAYIVVKKVM